MASKRIRRMVGFHSCALGFILAAVSNARQATTAWLLPALLCSGLARSQPPPPDVAPSQSDSGTRPLVPSSTQYLIESNRRISYVSAAGGIGSIEPLWFEGRFVAPFGLYRQYASVVVSMEAVLRMYREDSAPVKTPSFMPGLTLAGPRLYHSLVAVTLRHHSNGQSGNFYQNPTAPRDARVINHETGDFGTNFLEFAVLSATDKHVPVRDFALNLWGKLAFEVHPGFGFGEADELQGHGCSSGPYGRCRLNAAFDVTVRSKLFWVVQAENRLRLDYTFIFGDLDVPAVASHGPHPGPHILGATYVWKPVAKANDLGVFVNAYWGQDYYNIYFDRRLWVLRMGLAVYPFEIL